MSFGISSNRVRLSNEAIYPNRFAYLLKNHRAGRVLDIGNRGGRYGQGRSKSRHLEFAEHLDGRSILFGFDLFPPPREIKDLYRNQTRGDLGEGLPFQKDVFNTVYAGQMLEHMGNPLSVLKEIHRVLRSGGIFILDVPNPYAIRRLLRWIFKKEEYLGDPTHLIFYSPASLHALLKKAGFGAIEITNDWESQKRFVPRLVKLGMGSHLLAMAEK